LRLQIYNRFLFTQGFY